MKKLLITDLDDTLYDWLGFFIPAFNAMFKELSVITEIDESTLLKEYKEKHQYYGSVEYPFVTLELPSIHNKYKDLSIDEQKEILSEAFHKFNSVRKSKLKLFDGVEETLKMLCEKKITIVGYTESSQENGFYRLKKLDISQYFKHVYTSKSQFASKYLLDDRIMTVDTKKPNKDVLLDICKIEKCSTEEAVYVGDSITKDIYMAKMANITSVLTKYSIEKNDYYKRLVEITSWTDKDFERETKLKLECINKNIKPDFIIKKFDEIISLF